MLDQHKDLRYAGGCTLEGLDYEFLRLDRKARLVAPAGVTPETFPWAGIDAIVTDVRYDFEGETTTLQFSSDQMEFEQRDPARLVDWLHEQAQLARPRGPTIITYAFR